MNIRKVATWVLGVPLVLLVGIVGIGLIVDTKETGEQRESLVRTPGKPKPQPSSAKPLQALVPATPPPSRPRPEDIIVFSDSSVICMKQADLKQVILSGLRGEETKIRALVGSANGEAPCFMVPPTKRLKVLSANYPENDSMGLLEVVGETTTAARGAWVLSSGATIVRGPSMR